jgi:hypothetical protein
MDANIEHTEHGPVVTRDPTMPTVIRHVPAPPESRIREAPEGHTITLGGGAVTAGELRALGYVVDPRIADDALVTSWQNDLLPLPNEVRLVEVPGMHAEWAGIGSAAHEELLNAKREPNVAQRFLPTEGEPPAPAPVTEGVDMTAPPPEPPAKPVAARRRANGGNGGTVTEPIPPA